MYAVGNDEVEKYRAWLSKLRAGQQVAIREAHYGHRANYTLATVTRLTKTQALVQSRHGERRFNRLKGSETGRSYGPELVPLTDEVKTTMHQQQVHSRFQTVVVTNHKSLTHAEKVAILAAYDAVHVEEATHES